MMEDGLDILEDILVRANKAIEDLIPTKSRAIYDKEFKIFVDWKLKNEVTIVNETVMMAYFQELTKESQIQSKMKFLMSKKTCIPKTTNDVQKELCKKPDLGRSKFELLGPNNKYRDEYYELYLARCEEFKMKGKKIQDANMKALSNNKPKLGEIYRMMLVEVDQDEDTNRKAELKKSELKLTSATSLSSFSNIREVGIALRKRHERYYRDVWDVNEKQCYFDPWFRRYLILCRFISAARKIIIKSRLLKRLAVFKELKRNKELIPVYEDQYIKIQHLSYANVFAKFDPL